MTAEAAPPDVKPCKLVDYGVAERPRFGLMLVALWPTKTFFEERGLTGNGHEWAAFVKHELLAHAPSVMKEVSFDPEADMLVVRSSNLDTLLTVATLIRALHTDLTRLDAAVTALKRARTRPR